MSLKNKIITKSSEFIIRKKMQKDSKVSKELENWTSNNPFNAKNGNPSYEDAYMKDYNIAQKRGGRCYRTDNGHIPPLSRNIKSWTEEDARKVIASDEYKKDPQIFNKVKSYYEYKYPD